MWLRRRDDAPRKYTNMTRILSRYTACTKTNFLRQGFRKLSSDRHTCIHTQLHTWMYIQTEGQTQPKLYTTPLRGWWLWIKAPCTLYINLYDFLGMSGYVSTLTHVVSFIRLLHVHDKKLGSASSNFMSSDRQWSWSLHETDERRLTTLHTRTYTHLVHKHCMCINFGQTLIFKNLSIFMPPATYWTNGLMTVSYTHLTLPTKRIV